MTHLSLFSGIGGLDLAAEWAGFRTVGQCEWADYPTKVLEKHWPDVPRWRDIRTLTKESFYGRTGLRTVDVVSGGFPCQPFSVAGKRRGEEDDRYFWPEMLRVISELRPAWVVGENVAGIVNMALDQVLSDLEGIGYACQAFTIPACAVDAPHRRDRVAIVANRKEQGERGLSVQPWDTRSSCSDSDWSCEDVAYSDSGTMRHDRHDRRPPTGKVNTLINAGFSGGAEETAAHSHSLGPGKSWRQARPIADDSRWAAEPNVGRVAHGVPYRVDRLKCLGNAVVPQQFYPVFQAIADIERGGVNVERLTSSAEGYCEKYCPDYIMPGCDPEKCAYKNDVAMYEALKSIEGIVPFDRLRELAQADRDGKLPKYTIGDIIYDRFGMAWTVDSLEYVQCTYEKKWLYRCGHPGTDDYRGLYQDEVLTRAEAEAALRREQE